MSGIATSLERSNDVKLIEQMSQTIWHLEVSIAVSTINVLIDTVLSSNPDTSVVMLYTIQGDDAGAVELDSIGILEGGNSTVFKLVIDATSYWELSELVNKKLLNITPRQMEEVRKVKNISKIHQDGSSNPDHLDLEGHVILLAKR